MPARAEGASMGPTDRAVCTRSSVGALRMAAIRSRISVEFAPLPCASNAFWSLHTARMAHCAAQVALFLAGGLPVPLEEREAVRGGSGHDLDVDHGIDVALDRRRRG